MFTKVTLAAIYRYYYVAKGAHAIGSVSQNVKEDELLPLALRHPARRALTSHWSVNSFVMRNVFSHAFDKKFRLQENSHRQPL